MDNWIPMECQLTINGQLITNPVPMDNWIPMDCQLTIHGQLITNAISINNQWQLITTRVSIVFHWTIDYQCIINRVPMERKLTIDNCWLFARVPPLKNNWGTSRPMRNQHFELLTNQKPRFQHDSRCWQNLKSINPAPMCKLSENQVTLT